MYEQNKNSTERSKILVVYDYHPEETFQREVALELQKKNLPNVTFAKYNGKHIPREKDLTFYPINKFAKKYLPLDYCVDLHSSPDAVDIPEKKLKIPYFWFVYGSKVPLSKDLISDLRAYQENLEKKANRYVLNYKFLRISKDFPENYAKFNIEFFPRYVTKNEAIEQLEGLISILYHHPLHRHKV